MSIWGSALHKATSPWQKFGSKIQTGAKSIFGGLDRSNNEFRDPGQASDYGLPGYNSQYNQYSNLSNQYGNRDINAARYSGFRKQQQQLGGMLRAEANGNGVGQRLVRQQAQDMADRGVGQQLAMANSARPGNQALAARNAAFASGGLQSAVGGQAAQAGLQAQLGAMGQYGQFLQGARGADEDMNKFNVDANLRLMGLNDQAQLEALRQRLGASQSQQQGSWNYQNQRGNRFNAMMGNPTQTENALGAVQGILQSVYKPGK